MKPTTKLLAAALALLLLLAGCSTAAQPTEAAAMNVAALNGPTGIGMVNLMKESETTDYAAFDPSFTLASSPDELASALLSGDADIAALPTNLAATLYARSEGGVKLIALNTLGVLYVLEKGDSVQSLSDLAGKTLYATGAASLPEYVVDYILTENDLAQSVAVEYYAQHAELAAMAVAGDVDLCVLPEPFVTQVTAQNPDMRVALSITDEWNALTGGAQLSMGCLVVRTEYYEAHPQAVAEFLRAYADSAAAANSEVEATAALVVEYGIMGNEALAASAIPRCNIVCVTGAEMKAGAQALYEVLYAANPSSVGGAMPDDGLYLTDLG